MFLIFCLIFGAFLALSSAKCPDGAIASLSNPSNCYFFESQKLNFMGAEEFCVKNGGHLVSIHNAFDDAFIDGEAATGFTDSVSDDFWIGANNLLIPGVWSWMDGTLFDFTDWGKGQPVNTTGSNCGAMLLSAGTWSSTDCLNIKPFVCITKAIVPSTTVSIMTTTTKPKTCDFGWTFYDFTGFCYKVYDTRNWQEAEDWCKIDGAHLTSIHSSEENLFLENFANYPGANICDGHNQSWIGLYTEDSNAHWKWTDGTPFDYINWVEGAPWGGQVSCGFMNLAPICGRPGAQIENYPCETILNKFICKKLAIYKY